jgi:hypothetical protein
MSTKEQASKGGENPVSRGRHEHQCRICSHSKREEIEQAFIAWGQSSTESQSTLSAAVRSTCAPTCRPVPNARASKLTGYSQ